MKILIIIPVYNESKIINTFHDRLLSFLSNLNHFFKLIYVDDGSKDNTANILLNLKSTTNVISTYLLLRKNYGKEIAILAGLDCIENEESIICIDGDLQHPIELIEKFIVEFNNVDAIIALRTNKSTTYLRNLLSQLFSRIFYKNIPKNIIGSPTDFCIISNAVAQEIINVRSRFRCFRFMINYGKFNTKYVSFTAHERINGKSSFNATSLIFLALTIAISYSKFFVVFGIFLTFFYFVLYIIATSFRLFFPEFINIEYIFTLLDFLKLNIIFYFLVFNIVYLYIINQKLQEAKLYFIKK